MEPYGEIGKKLSDGVYFAGWGLPRRWGDENGIKCAACHKGYACEVVSTEAECVEYGCGRDRPGQECCAVAFKCENCGARNVGKRSAPDY